MRQKDRRRCLDVAVKIGAECKTDHLLLCVTVVMRWVYYRRVQPMRERRFDMSKLDMEDHSRPTKRRVFQQQMTDRAAAEWPSGGTAE